MSKVSSSASATNNKEEDGLKEDAILGELLGKIKKDPLPPLKKTPVGGTVMAPLGRSNNAPRPLVSNSPLISRKSTGITRPAASAPLKRPLEEVTPSQNIEEFDSPDIQETDVPADSMDIADDEDDAMTAMIEEVEEADTPKPLPPTATVKVENNFSP